MRVEECRFKVPFKAQGAWRKVDLTSFMHSADRIYQNPDKPYMHPPKPSYRALLHMTIAKHESAARLLHRFSSIARFMSLCGV